jgi:hypothetical protein
MRLQHDAISLIATQFRSTKSTGGCQTRDISLLPEKTRQARVKNQMGTWWAGGGWWQGGGGVLQGGFLRGNGEEGIRLVALGADRIRRLF